jgi:uncharacterized membrane protein
LHSRITALAIASAVFLYNSITMITRWLPYALLCSIFLATADFFVKLASTKISASMGMFIYGATTFAFGLVWVSYIKITGQPLLVTQTGLLYSFAVGLAFSLVTMLLYLTFARVSVSLGSPTIRLMGILIASLVKEGYPLKYVNAGFERIDSLLQRIAA